MIGARMDQRLKVSGVLLVAALVIAVALYSLWPIPRSSPAKATVAIVTWVGYGPFFVAKEKGFFRNHGADVDIVKIEDLAPRHSALTSGSVQFSISTLDLFANEAPQGLPAVCILKLTDSYGADGIIARKTIQSLPDLRGRTIAFEKGTPSHFFLISLLETLGLSVKDIAPKYMTAGDAGAAFVAGSVDAAVTWEPWLTKARETSFGHVLVTSRERPGLLLYILVVHRDFLRRQPKVVEALVRGWFEAVEFSRTHADEANVIMAKGLGLEKAEFVEMMKGDRLSDYAENRRYFGLDGAPGPFFDTFNRAQSVWLGEGLITKTVSAEQVVDLTFLRALTK